MFSKKLYLIIIISVLFLLVTLFYYLNTPNTTNNMLNSEDGGSNDTTLIGATSNLLDKLVEDYSVGKNTLEDSDTEFFWLDSSNYYINTPTPLYLTRFTINEPFLSLNTPSSEISQIVQDYSQLMEDSGFSPNSSNTSTSVSDEYLNYFVGHENKDYVCKLTLNRSDANNTIGLIGCFVSKSAYENNKKEQVPLLSAVEDYFIVNGLSSIQRDYGLKDINTQGNYASANLWYVAGRGGSLVVFDLTSSKPKVLYSGQQAMTCSEVANYPGIEKVIDKCLDESSGNYNTL